MPDAPGPVRTCVGCRRRAPAEELVRLVVDGEGNLVIGRTLPGRGAWLCPSTSCFDAATRRRAFDRALRAGVRAGIDEVRAALAARPGTGWNVRG